MSFARDYVLSKFFGKGSSGSGDLKALVERTITEIEDNAIEVVGKAAFRYCNALTKAHFLNATVLCDESFANCGALTDLYFPKVATLPADPHSFYGIFRGCKAITEVTQEQFPALTVLTGGIFRDCTNITRVSMPNVTQIEWYALEGCNNLSEVNFPNLRSIGMNGWHFKIASKRVVFPKVKYVFNYAAQFSGYKCIDFASTSNEVLTINATGNFDLATILTALIIRSSAVAILTGAPFGNTPIASGTGYIYVPKALLSDDDATKDYRRATNWATYATQFRALEDYTVDGTVTGELDESKI